MKVQVDTAEYHPLIDKKRSFDEGQFKAKAYPTRWFALLVFSLHLLDTNVTWINIGSIAELAECYYDVDVIWINALSYTYMVTYVLLFVVAVWLLKRYGLRTVAICGACFNAAGAWLKFSGSGPGYFWILLAGQVVSSILNVLEWGAPSYISAVWFPPNERAFATTMVAATAPQVGILLSLLLSPLVVHHDNTDTVCNKTLVSRTSPEFLQWQDVIQTQMFYYLLGQAVFASIIVPLTFLLPEAPPTPPSMSKHVEDEIPNVPLYKSFLEIFKNVKFLVFTVIFGISLGVSNVYVTVFDEILKHLGYSGYQQDVGYLGLAIQVSAIACLLAVGRWIDWSKTFYCTALVLLFGSAILSVGYSLVLQFHLQFYVVCVVCALAVGVTIGFQGVAYEYGVEMTFPVPEILSASLLNMVSQLMAGSMIVLSSYMIDRNWSLYVNWCLVACLLLASLLQIFVRPKLRRLELDGTKQVGCPCYGYKSR